MSVEVLLATMFFENEEADFLEKMNIQSDIIVGNQCDRNENERYEFRGNTVQVLSRSERGVGKNRNAALFHSNADFVVFADNDVSYFDGYRQVVEEYYREHPDADVVIFNFRVSRGDEALRDINKKNKKAKMNDLTRFGAWAVTARRESILKKRISFSLLFGGGAPYSCGEDTLFLIDCYKKGLNIYLSDQTLGRVIHKESTWYNGITEKFVFDKGALFQATNPRLYQFVICYHVLKHRDMYGACGNAAEVIRLMLRGAREYKLRASGK